MAGERVLWLTLEELDLAAARKVLAAEAKVPILALEDYTKPDAATDKQRDRVQVARKSIAELPIYIDCTTAT